MIGENMVVEQTLDEVIPRPANGDYLVAVDDNGTNVYIGFHYTLTKVKAIQTSGSSWTRVDCTCHLGDRLIGVFHYFSSCDYGVSNKWGDFTPAK